MVGILPITGVCGIYARLANKVPRFAYLHYLPQIVR